MGHMISCHATLSTCGREWTCFGEHYWFMLRRVWFLLPSPNCCFLLWKAHSALLETPGNWGCWTNTTLILLCRRLPLVLSPVGMIPGHPVPISEGAVTTDSLLGVFQASCARQMTFPTCPSATYLSFTESRDDRGEGQPAAWLFSQSGLPCGACLSLPPLCC